ncbi:alkene reductase [Pseudomonas sp. 148P]|uniref:Alkene reductase n=1 Tax=Pseudomonas ulcerans TaxID=3115852 RepID=A0ABU7HNJ1_9PSED|nr:MULTISPECIES: alkene reductase [unclassified Pseudomonas]MEE1923604.1 alkene reductase [Pseudomonas sp. 147P]MEE1933102.1 alkene reductase [Pseudomonas sp. 148P]
MSILFEPVRLGELQLANRIVMAPMTRSRADARAVPGAEMVEYYRQRAAAGLIVAEGTAPSASGLGYCRTPAIYTAEQIAAWRRVTEAVHGQGGRIVLQLMHVGRAASRFNKPQGAATVAPSAIRAQTQVFSDAQGMVDTETPEALSLDGIAGVIGEYRQAALNAREAGFDGVELHCTSGYLPMQFLASGSNQRSDAYGGSAENRVRFVAETVQAMAAAIGAGRVAVRLCPGNPYNDIHDEDPAGTAIALCQALQPLSLAYLHVMRSPVEGLDAFGLAREHAGQKLVLNDGFDADSARAALEAGEGVAVSFGRHFIGNPDLVERLRRGQPLAGFERKTLYTTGSRGYTDYPTFSQALEVTP